MRLKISVDRRKLRQHGVEQARERLRHEQAKRSMLIDQALKRALRRVEASTGDSETDPPPTYSQDGDRSPDKREQGSQGAEPTPERDP